MSIRAYLEVFLIVLILLLVCAGLWLWRDKDNALSTLIAAQAQHKTDVAIHNDDAATISRITTFNTQNDRLLANFVTAISGIDRAFGKLNSDISNLRRKNPDVESYLAQPIPHALLCLLRGGVCDETPAPSPAH